MGRRIQRCSNGLRKAGQSLVGKIIATVLFGFLIVSFAIWGIGDIFRTTAARPSWRRSADVEISVEQFRTAYTRRAAAPQAGSTAPSSPPSRPAPSASTSRSCRAS